MNRKTIYASGAAALLLLFAACEMIHQKPAPLPGAEGGVAVHISIAGADSRTAAPAIALQDAAWQLWGGKDEDTETLRAEFPSTGGRIFLEPGTWHFTLKGYNKDKKFRW
jgi:hypothetical protein